MPNQKNDKWDKFKHKIHRFHKANRREIWLAVERIQPLSQRLHYYLKRFHPPLLAYVHPEYRSPDASEWLTLASKAYDDSLLDWVEDGEFSEFPLTDWHEIETNELEIFGDKDS